MRLSGFGPLHQKVLVALRDGDKTPEEVHSKIADSKVTLRGVQTGLGQLMSNCEGIALTKLESGKYALMKKFVSDLVWDQ